MADREPRRPSDKALELGHEPRDISPARIAMVGIAVIGLIGLLALVPWGMTSLFGLWAPQRPATAVERADLPAPEPRLDATPGGTAAEVLARQRELLEAYGWVDEAEGLARIPIEQAMAILADRGDWPEPDGGRGTALRGPAYLPSESAGRGGAPRDLPAGGTEAFDGDRSDGMREAPP
jgi:hypothetical protein